MTGFTTRPPTLNITFMSSDGAPRPSGLCVPIRSRIGVRFGSERGPLQRPLARSSPVATDGLPAVGGNGRLRRKPDSPFPLIPATVEQP